MLSWYVKKLTCAVNDKNLSIYKYFLFKRIYLYDYGNDHLDTFLEIVNVNS